MTLKQSPLNFLHSSLVSCANLLCYSPWFESLPENKGFEEKEDFDGQDQNCSLGHRQAIISETYFVRHDAKTKNPAFDRTRFYRFF